MIDIKKFGSSIFVKLLFSMLLTIIAVNITLFWGFKMVSELPARSEYFKIHAEKYVEFLAKDVHAAVSRSPIDVEALQSIEEKLAVSLLVETTAKKHIYGSFASSIDEIKGKSKKHHMHGGSLWVAFIKNRMFVKTEISDIRILISVNRFHDIMDSSWKLYVVIFSTLTVLLALCYFFVRKFLAPVKKIDEAVSEVAKGNLDIHLNVKSRDELGQLAGSFNSMTSKLREIIGAQQQLMIDVSHELRSPIGRVRLAAEMLGEGTGKDDIIADTRELEALTGNILDGAKYEFSVLQEGCKPVALGKIIKRICERYDMGQIEIDTQGLHSLPMVLGVVDQIEHVLRNLIDNALKYSNAKIPVKIESFYQDGMAGVIVRDHGPGIPEADLEKVFEPFYRADASRSRDTGGYGLGLYICKKAINAMKGKIALNNSGDGLDATLLFEVVR